MPRQFVSCAYRPSDRRSYTFHNDGEPVKVGDIVKLPDRSGDGWTRGYVVDMPFDPPTVATKAILGKVEPEGDG